MTKSPFLNASAATLYIIFVTLIMNFGSQMAPRSQSLLVPIAVVSLFTLSAAVMGYLFCYQHLQLYFEKKKKQAVTLFLQTVAVFAMFTLVALGLLFFGLGK